MNFPPAHFVDGDASHTPAFATSIDTPARSQHLALMLAAAVQPATGEVYFPHLSKPLHFVEEVSSHFSNAFTYAGPTPENAPFFCTKPGHQCLGVLGVLLLGPLHVMVIPPV
jgi:hypothetical protein